MFASNNFSTRAIHIQISDNAIGGIDRDLFGLRVFTDTCVISSFNKNLISLVRNFRNLTGDFNLGGTSYNFHRVSFADWNAANFVLGS